MPDPADPTETATPIETATPTAAAAVGVARILFGTGVTAVLVYGYFEGLSHGRTNPFDYFGYFTNLTSLLTSAILIASGSSTIRGRRPGTASASPWVSVILHAVLPLAAVLDWLLVGDRPRLPWRRIWIVLPYPVLWLTVVLVRGATDGWVPYGFLLPERGLQLLAATVAGLLATLLVAAAGVWAGSRLRGVRGALRR